MGGGLEAFPYTLSGPFQGSRVLITGGLGFIGSNLARRLVDLGAHVTLVDCLLPQYGGNLHNIAGIEDRVRVNVSDVRDRYATEQLVKDQDFLFNLAGQTSHLDSMTDPRTDLEINAAAQLSILEACRASNPAVRVVFASTRQVYGKPAYLPVDEAHPIRPVDVNGVNKLAGELYHLIYHEVHGIQACVLRLTNVYGPRMRVKDARQTFLGIWVRRLIEGNPLLVFGDGTQIRDFVYVDDCVEALLLAADGAHVGKTYNIGGNEVVNLAALAGLLTGLGFGGTFQTVPFPADRKVIDIGDYHSDYSRFHGATGWSPTVPLREGLRRTMLYYQAHSHRYWDPSE